MELESGNDSIQDELRQMDTCQWSLLHYLFTRPPTEQVTFIKSYFVPYVIIVLLFYVMPLVVVLAKAPNMLWNNPDLGLKVGFLDDWNMILMYLVVLPVLIIFTLRERSMIPSKIGEIVEEGVLSVDKTGGTARQIGRFGL